MDVLDVVRAVAALALTLGLIGVAGWAARRWGPSSLFKLSPGARERRMRVVESMLLDPQRRLVLVSLDGAEHLLLLGEGRLLKSGAANPMPAPPSSEITS